MLGVCSRVYPSRPAPETRVTAKRFSEKEDRLLDAFADRHAPWNPQFPDGVLAWRMLHLPEVQEREEM